MIKLEMHGRLGNQMFRYALARKLQKKTGLPITVSFRFVRANYSKEKQESYDRGWENSLKYFNTAPMQEYTGNQRVLFYKPNWIQSIIGAFFILYHRKYRNKGIQVMVEKQMKWANILNRFGLFCISNGFYEYTNFTLRSYYIDGSFESSAYFNDIRETILQDFTPKNPPLRKNQHLYNLLASSNSVCVTIRTFKEIEHNKKMHNIYDVCQKEYFRKGMEYICSKVENPLFLICSDDIQWVKQNIDLKGFHTIFEEGNDPVWEKLRLMYSCKHFVISNSTFSWWAQYLSRNNHKIVVAPKRWFNDKFEGYLIEDWMVKI